MNHYYDMLEYKRNVKDVPDSLLDPEKKANAFARYMQAIYSLTLPFPENRKHDVRRIVLSFYPNIHGMNVIFWREPIDVDGELVTISLESQPDEKTIPLIKIPKYSEAAAFIAKSLELRQCYWTRADQNM